jgi:hypothetical protein
MMVNTLTINDICQPNANRRVYGISLKEAGGYHSARLVIFYMFLIGLT